MIHTENLQFGIMTAVIGIAMVMAVLIIISLLLGLFAVINNIGKSKKAPVEPMKVKLPQKKTEESVVTVAEDIIDDTELIAVISAAIAASMNTTTDKIVVRSVKKVQHWKNNTINRANRARF